MTEPNLPLPEPEADPLPLLLTQRQAAERLGVSVPTFAKHVRPDLECVKVGSDTRYPEAVLIAWVEKNTTRHAPL